MRKINDRGGLTIAQDPATAEVSTMPRSAIDAGVIDHVLSLEEITDFILTRFMQASSCE
jgi:two-component system chemotaxis response regulator CheB